MSWHPRCRRAEPAGEAPGDRRVIAWLEREEAGCWVLPSGCRFTVRLDKHPINPCSHVARKLRKATRCRREMSHDALGIDPQVAVNQNVAKAAEPFQPIARRCVENANSAELRDDVFVVFALCPK